jgi:hypothetical protein
MKLFEMGHPGVGYSYDGFALGHFLGWCVRWSSSLLCPETAVGRSILRRSPSAMPTHRKSAMNGAPRELLDKATPQTMKLFEMRHPNFGTAMMILL